MPRIGSAIQLQSTGHAQAEKTHVQRTVSLQTVIVIFVSAHQEKRKKHSKHIFVTQPERLYHRGHCILT